MHDEAIKQGCRNSSCVNMDDASLYYIQKKINMEGHQENMDSRWAEKGRKGYHSTEQQQ